MYTIKCTRDWKVVEWFRHNEFELVWTFFFLGKGNWKNKNKIRTFNRKWESPHLNCGLDWGPYCFILRKLKMRFSPEAPSLESAALHQLLSHGRYMWSSVYIPCKLSGSGLHFYLYFLSHYTISCSFYKSELLKEISPEAEFNSTARPDCLRISWDPDYCFC
jgi:hypothetical protein